MMSHLEDEEATEVVALSEKIDKMLSGKRRQIAVAALNFTFIKIVLSQEGGLLMAQAMAATFMHNAMNTINSFYSSEDEPVH
jgi:hypothetical protein